MAGPPPIRGEQPSAIFTTKRLVVRDSQGMTGKKVEVYSLPYSAINMWSSENARTFDMDAELELWTRAGHIKIKVGKKTDIRRLDMLIAHFGPRHPALSTETIPYVDAAGPRIAR